MRNKKHRFRISAVERILFARRMSLYLRSGIPIMEALHLIQTDARSVSQKKIVAGVLEDVRRGISLSRALAAYPCAYQEFHIQIIAVGETSGTLADAFSHLADVLARRLRLARSIAGSLAYPALVLVGTLGISGFLVFYAFPKIVPLFRGFHTQLPFTTRSLIWISEVSRRDGWYIGGFVVVSLFVFWFLLRRPRVRKRIDATLLLIPLLGECIRCHNIAAVFRIMAVLLRSGVRLNAALILASQGIQNTTYQTSLEEMEHVVMLGMKCTSVMQSYPSLYPALAVQLIAAGEMTGTLSESASTVADIYEESLEERLRSIATLIEPVLMMVMGLVVGFVALAIITPMYSLTQTLSQ